MFGFGSAKKKVADDMNWRKLEKAGVDSKHFKDYNIQSQKYSKSAKKRPDYFGVHKKDPHKRVVGDAKCVKELTKDHIDQIKGYKGHPFYGRKGVAVVCKDTKVPHEVTRYAKKSNIAIDRLPVKRKKGIFDF